MKKIFLSPRFLLPVAIVMGVSVVTLRVADLWEMVTSGKLLVQSAQAETAPPKVPEKEKTPVEAKGEDSAPADDLYEPRLGTPPPPPEAETSAAEMDLLGKLVERREQLEKRSRDLDAREALLKITEQRVDQKIKEMDLMRQQIQSLVNQVAGAQQAQLGNLIKIYETMKPDEAARIFETLDMPILLGVIQGMKPARTALVMAKLSAEKAREVTVALTKQDQLPQIK